MKTNSQRLSLLKAVANLQPDYAIAMKEIEKYPWDFEGNPLIITRSVFKYILSDYIEGKRSAEEIFNWADFLELREDIDFPKKDRPVLLEMLHVLANPLLEGELTRDKAKNLMSQISISYYLRIKR